MKARHLVLCGLVWLVTDTHAVRADLTAFWRNNPITAVAITNDPTLTTMQSWSLMGTNTTGLFHQAGLRAVLPAGSTFYRHPNGGEYRPTFAQQVANPALTFHTYVTDPTQSFQSNGGAPAIPGGFPELQPLSFGGPFDDIPGTFSVSWFDIKGPTLHPPGTYELARLTFPRGVFPAVHQESLVRYLGPEQMVLIPRNIPDPDVAGLTLSTALLLGLCRLRR